MRVDACSYYRRENHGSYTLTCGTNVDSCLEMLQVLHTWATEINETAIRKSKNCQQLARCYEVQISPSLELGKTVTILTQW